MAKVDDSIDRELQALDDEHAMQVLRAAGVWVVKSLRRPKMIPTPEKCVDGGEHKTLTLSTLIASYELCEKCGTLFIDRGKRGEYCLVPTHCTDKSTLGEIPPDVGDGNSDCGGIAT